MKYEGQKQTCSFCAETGHNKKDCEKNINLNSSKSEAKVKLHQELQQVKRDPNPGLMIEHMKMNKANKVAIRLHRRLVTSQK